MLSTYISDEFKELYKSRIEQVVLVAIVLEGSDNRLHQVSSDDIPIVEVISHGDYSPEEPNSTWNATIIQTHSMQDD